MRMKEGLTVRERARREMQRCRERERERIWLGLAKDRRRGALHLTPAARTGRRPCYPPRRWRVPPLPSSPSPLTDTPLTTPSSHPALRHGLRGQHNSHLPSRAREWERGQGQGEESATAALRGRASHRVGSVRRPHHLLAAGTGALPSTSPLQFE